MNRSRTFNYIKNIILPCLVFSLITGTLVSVVIVFFKIAVSFAIEKSEMLYTFLHRNPVYLPAAVAVTVVIAFIAKYFYRVFPDSKGGGIPTSIAILRGIVSFRWLRNLFGVITASLTTFLLGIPLGNEGPCVQIGTAIGRGVVRTLGRGNLAWDRYVMTGGACAGFSVATGAPISGIFFAIEEAHRRLCPMIIMVATTTVMFASGVSAWISPIFGVSETLLGPVETIIIPLRQLWIPAVIGLGVGLFSVLFIKLNGLISSVISKFFRENDVFLKILITLILTLGFGMISFSFLGTGHSQIESILEAKTVFIYIIPIIVFRSALMLFANNSGATGGMFVPILALSAMFTALLARLLLVFGIPDTYYTTIILLGITAGLASTIKTPVTAVVFAMEALSLSNNVLPIITVVTVAFMITEIFGAKSINESVIETRVHQLNEGKTVRTYDANISVKPNSFVVGKAIRDIFWPNNLFVLSICHSADSPEVDRHGDKSIRDGDILHVRFSTQDYDSTIEELVALTGDNNISAQKEENV